MTFMGDSVTVGGVVLGMGIVGVLIAAWGAVRAHWPAGGEIEADDIRPAVVLNGFASVGGGETLDDKWRRLQDEFRRFRCDVEAKLDSLSWSNRQAHVDVEALATHLGVRITHTMTFRDLMERRSVGSGPATVKPLPMKRADAIKAAVSLVADRPGVSTETLEQIVSEAIARERGEKIN